MYPCLHDSCTYFQNNLKTYSHRHRLSLHACFSNVVDEPKIYPDAAPHLHQFGRPEPSRGRRGRVLHDGREGESVRHFEEDDIITELAK